MAKVIFSTPDELTNWLKEHDAPEEIVSAAERVIQHAARHSLFDIVLDNLLDHPSADNPAAVEFGSHVPEDVKVAERIAMRLLMDPRLKITRAP